MTIRYTVEESAAFIHPKVSSHTYQVARVMDVELGSELFSRKTIDGVIRLAADQSGIGKSVDIERVFSELVSSGFLSKIEVNK